MQNIKSVMKMFYCCLLLCTVIIGTTISTEASEAVNVMLKNSSSSTIEVELTDQYGGNYTITLDSGAVQNHTVMMNSEVKVKDGDTHVVTADDEGKEVIIAGE